MWRYIPDLLATPVPRYTSFPTAAEFGDDVGPRDMATGLAEVGDDEDISLYLHIPYCREICWYCGCNTGAANRTSRVSAYLQRLGEEIDMVAARLDGRGVVRRIAWGGGSPNAIAPEEFDALMYRIAAAFRCVAPVVSIEIDPRCFDWSWAAALARHNVTRVSLGVQTFAPHIQRAIGRVQPIEDIACVVTQLRAAFVSSINFDLMYGLPSQSVADLDATLEEAIALQPDRLAVFGYAHVPHLLPRQRRIDETALPTAATRFDQAATAYDKLSSAGYLPVGFDHFALPHDEIALAIGTGEVRRNFQGFTEDRSRILIGLGASAISAFPGWLLQNEKNAGRYHLRIGSGGFATARGLRRSPQDQRIGAAIEQLLCHGEADLSAIRLSHSTEAALSRFQLHDLVTRQGSQLTIAPEGLPYARSIAATLDPYRTPNQVRFSNAV